MKIKTLKSVISFKYVALVVWLNCDKWVFPEYDGTCRFMLSDLFWLSSD